MSFIKSQPNTDSGHVSTLNSSSQLLSIKSFNSSSSRSLYPEKPFEQPTSSSTSSTFAPTKSDLSFVDVSSPPSTSTQVSRLASSLNHLRHLNHPDRKPERRSNRESFERLERLISESKNTWDVKTFQTIPSKIDKKLLPSYPHGSLTPSVTVSALNVSLLCQNKESVISAAIPLTHRPLINSMSRDASLMEEMPGLVPPSLKSTFDDEGGNSHTRRSDTIPFPGGRMSVSSVPDSSASSPKNQFKISTSLRRLPKVQRQLLLAQQRAEERREAEITSAGERHRALLSFGSVDCFPGDDVEVEKIKVQSTSVKTTTSLGEQIPLEYPTVQQFFSPGTEDNHRLRSATLGLPDDVSPHIYNHDLISESVVQEARRPVSKRSRIAKSQEKWKQGIKGEHRKLRVVIALSSWMGHPKIREMYLWDVCIPGTHNSASWKLSEDHHRKWSGMVFAFLKLYIHCQESTIFQQLQLGIRFLDLRVCKSITRTKEAFCAHGGFRTILFKDVLEQINAFLERRPTEVIILSVRRDVAYLTGPGSLGILESDFWVAACLKRWLGSQLESNVTIGQLVDRKQNVLYFFEERERFLPPIQDGDISEFQFQTATTSSTRSSVLPSGFLHSRYPSDGKPLDGTTEGQQLPVQSDVIGSETPDKALIETTPFDQCSGLTKDVSVSFSSSDHSRRQSVSSTDYQLAHPRRSIIATMLSPRLAPDTTFQEFKTKALLFTPSRTRTHSIGSETSELGTPSEFVRVDADGNGHQESLFQSTPSMEKSQETSPDLISLYRPRRQLTRWVRRNVPKYWITRLESMPDPLFSELFGENSGELSQESLNEKWREWFGASMRYPELQFDDGTSKSSGRPFVVPDVGSSSRRYSEATIGDVRSIALRAKSFHGETMDETVPGQNESHRDKPLQSQQGRSRLAPFKVVQRNVKRLRTFPTAAKKKLKLLSNVVTAAVKMQVSSEVSGGDSKGPLEYGHGWRADSLSFVQENEKLLKATEKALESRHKEAIDAARALVAAQGKQEAEGGENEGNLEPERVRIVEEPLLDEKKKTKIKKRRSVRVAQRQPVRRKEQRDSQRSVVNSPVVENFLQTMRTMQDCDRGGEILEKANQEADDCGYASDRSGITAFPAAKAMGNLLGDSGASIGEALEKAGVDAEEIGIEEPPSSRLLQTKMSTRMRYSDPDLQRLLDQTEVDRRPEEESSFAGRCTSKSMDLGKTVENKTGPGLRSKRCSRSFNTFRGSQGVDEDDHLIQRRQSTKFRGFREDLDISYERQYERARSLLMQINEMQEEGRLEDLFCKPEAKEDAIKEEIISNDVTMTKRLSRSSVSNPSIRLTGLGASAAGIETHATSIPLDLPTEALPDKLRNEIISDEEHRKKRAARMARTAQRHRPSNSPMSRPKKLPRDEIVQNLLRQETTDEIMAPLTPFVSGRTRIQKSWNMTCDPDPKMLCKKLVYWTTLQGCQRPRKPFIIKMLAGEVTPPSFDSPETSMQVVRFWTVQGASALVLRNGGLRAAAVETHKLLLSNVLNRAITNRVNGITHDFVSEAVVSRIVKLNIIASVGPEEVGKLKSKTKGKENEDVDVGRLE